MKVVLKLKRVIFSMKQNHTIDSKNFDGSLLLGIDPTILCCFILDESFRVYTLSSAVPFLGIYIARPALAFCIARSHDMASVS